MSKQVIAVASAAVLGLLVGALLLDRPTPVRAAGDNGGGTFHVVASQNAFVLYDSTDAARSWVLIPQAADKKHAWFPVKRLDTDQAAQVWRIGKGESTGGGAEK